MWLTAGGLKSRFERQGKGRPLVLLHGVSHGLEIFEPIVPFLMERFDVIRYSQSGLDGSETPPLPLSMSALGDQFVSVLDALDITKAAIMAVSFGGWIAQDLLCRHAARIDACILGCSYSADIEHRIAPPPDKQAQLIELLTGDMDDVTRGQGFFEAMYGQPFKQAHPQAAASITQALIDKPLDLKMMCERVALSQAFDLKAPIVEGLAIPVLAMSGNEDQVVSPANLAMLKQDIPAQATVLFEGTGHCFFQEQPQKVAQTIIDFI